MEFIRHSEYHYHHFLLRNKKSSLLINHLHDDDNSYDIVSAEHMHQFGEININLFLFYDLQLYRRFNFKKDRLYKYLYAITNSVALTFNNLPLKRLARFQFTIIDIQQLHYSIQIDGKANGEQYRQSFRNYYRESILLKHHLYAACILLTGYNFRYRRNQTDTQGLASVGYIACNVPEESFILVEARSYRTAFIMAHELGHVLNMYHDEEMSQDSMCAMNYLMSSTTGPGKTQFSICSYSQLKQYLINMNEKVAKCFRHRPNNPLIRLPCEHNDCFKHLSITVDEQCKMALGETFRANIFNTKFISICTRIQCTNDLVNIYIDPAIENTECAPNKYCRGGECV